MQRRDSVKVDGNDIDGLCARLQPCSFCVTAVACLPASAGIGCRHGRTCRISASKKEASMAGEVQ